MIDQVNWNYPTDIRLGENRIGEIVSICSELNIAAPLLVTDPGLCHFDFIKQILSEVENAGLGIQLFYDIKPNPTRQNIISGMAAFKQGRHDSVIAIGGGSALDAGKVIALMAGQSCDLWALVDEGDNWKSANAEKIAPIIAIPTTAGTGSEVGRASVIVDEEEQVKKIIFHPKMLPGIVILDPVLTVGLPARLTAATGMDALSHNLEALCSPFFHPMAKGIAKQGIKLIMENLYDAYSNGANIEARAKMLVASTMGATAFQAGLGAMHALAHPLGAVYDAHHGLLNAILMPYVLKANRHCIEPVIGELSSFLNLKNAEFDFFLDQILSLRAKLAIPARLGQINIGADKAEQIGKMAVKDPSSITNPIQFRPEQYSEIFCQAVNGELA